MRQLVMNYLRTYELSCVMIRKMMKSFSLSYLHMNRILRRYVDLDSDNRIVKHLILLAVRAYIRMYVYVLMFVINHFINF